jgi:polar amino acid transport system substrate-binding protein
MNTTRSRALASAGALLVAATLVGSLAGCSTSAAPASSVKSNKILIGAEANGAASATKLTVPEVASIRKELPKSVLASGQLVIGIGDLPAGFPPLAFTGDDQKTQTGSEPDLGRLIAAVFGLKPVLKTATWDNLFVGIDTGATNVGLSNITDTEQRKEKYDFASYRQDNLGFEVLKKSKWNFNGNYQNLAGKTVAVSSGTNQEKILLEWQTQLKAEGKTLTIKYYPDSNSTYLALDSGKIDASFGPNPGIAYHVSQDIKTVNATRNAGKFSGAGATLQGLIAATTKKNDGLAKPLAAAINYLIKHGQYAKWLKVWNLSNEAVPTSKINPPGLPLSNQ